MDDNNLEEEQKQAERDQASQKTAHVAGKAAATYFGGGLGAKAYDLASKTKVGQSIENAAGKALQKQPGLNKAMEGLNKSGALDAADKAMDATEGGIPDSKGIGNIANKPNEPKKSASPSVLNKSSQSSTQNDAEVDNSINSDYSGKIFSFIKSNWVLFIQIFGGFLLSIFCIIAVIVIIGSPVAVVNDIFSGIVDSIIGFLTPDQEELENEFYQELKDVQQEINNSEHVCIDVNLITAALTVSNSFDEMLDEGKDNVENAEELINDDGSVSSTLDYKKMKKNIKLLARMQVMTKKYGLDKSYKQSNGDYCKGSEEEVLVDSSNQSSFERSLFYWLGESSNIDSSTPELIAGHDKINFSAFFSKKVNEETNYAYYLYYPEASYENRKDINGNVVKDANGNAIQDRECDSTLPDDEYQLSIGNLSTMEESVFYWNLVNSFIPDYYDEYLPTTEPDRTEKIKRIAEEIYLLYQDIGPSMNCSSYGGNAYNCGSLDIINTSLTKEEFIAGINNYNTDSESWYLIKDNAEQIYDVSINNELNPEVVVTRAILEGFAPGNSCGSTNFNIWGWGATNGKECENGKVWKTWDEALLGFITGFKKSFPTSEAFFSKYAYLGDYWYNPGNSGLGGCYYAPYIYPDGLPEYVANACDISKKNKCTLDNTAGCVKTTDQDKKLYGQYQSKNTNDLRKKIWNLSDDTCGSYGIKEGYCVIFRQSDPRWESERLINGTTTLGRAGCAVTSVSIAMTCSGTLKDPDNFNPSILNKKLRANQGGALIDWKNPGINELTNGFHCVDKISDFNGNTEYKINTLKDLMQSRRALIVHTSSRIISPNAASHYVVLSSIDGTNARILDPATGKVGNWSVADIDQVIIYEW